MVARVLGDRELIEAHHAYMNSDTMSVEDLSERLGVSTVTIYNHWKRLGLGTKGPLNRVPENGDGYRIRDEEDERFLDAWLRYEQGGLTQRQIAHELGVSSDAVLVSRWKRIGCWRPGVTYKTDEDYEDAVRMYQEGVSVAAIAAKFDVTEKHIIKRLREMGVWNWQRPNRISRKSAMRLDTRPGRYVAASTVIWDRNDILYVTFGDALDDTYGAERRARKYVHKIGGTLA